MSRLNRLIWKPRLEKKVAVDVTTDYSSMNRSHALRARIDLLTSGLCPYSCKNKSEIEPLREWLIEWQNHYRSSGDYRQCRFRS